MKLEQCSEMSAYKIQTPGNYPEENIQQVACPSEYFFIYAIVILPDDGRYRRPKHVEDECLVLKVFCSFWW
jgi:hypothetical protein